MDSPLNARPNALPSPPSIEVFISMLGVIQLIAPFSVNICSPSLRVQITTGRLSPSIVYRMVFRLPFPCLLQAGPARIREGTGSAYRPPPAALL